MAKTFTVLGALASSLLLAAAGAVAANHGVPVAQGYQFTGAIDPAGDSDAFVIPLAAGGRLTVQVRAAAGSTLLPTLAMWSPGGNASDLSGRVRGVGTPRLALKDLPISETGLWAVVVGGTGPGTGAYEVSFAAKAPLRAGAKGAAVAENTVVDFPIAAGDGSLLSFVLHERTGISVAAVSVVDPDGLDVPVPPGAVVRKGKKVTGRSIPLNHGFGAYALRVRGPAGGSATVDVALSLKVPRPARFHGTLGPEPRPAALAPAVGRDGTPVVIDGAGFDGQARVRFGETWAAGGSVDSGTSIQVASPDGPESSAGLDVTVAVANPDGQENPVPGTFQFLGIPRPKSVAPSFLPPSGGYTVVIQGSNFRPGFSVSIGGVACPDAVLDPLGTISCTAPARPLGTSPIAVTDEFGRTGTLDAGITYIGPPTVAAASPGSSSFTGGRTVTLTGTNLHRELQVNVDGVPAGGIKGVDSTKIRFQMPAGPAGTFDVTVVDEFGRVATVTGLVRRRGPFVDATADAVPAAPPGTDFFGTVLALGDLDGNGSPELLVGSAYAPFDSVNYTYLTATRILFNDGNGVFTDATADRLGAFVHPRDRGQVTFAALGDLDGNAGAEVVLSMPYAMAEPYATFTRAGKSYAYAVAGSYGYNYTDPRTYPATRILANDGTGHLTEATAARVPTSGSTPFLGAGEQWQAAAGVLGDLDGDGHADLLLAASGPVVNGTVASTVYTGGVYYLLQSYAYLSSARVLINDGAGAFTAKSGAIPAPTFMNGNYSSLVAEGFQANAVSLGDLDGDGHPDLVLTRTYPRFVYHLDTKTGNYTTYYIPATRVLMNDGTGSFKWLKDALPAPYGNANPGSYEFWQGSSTALGDLDGDGNLDLVLGKPRATYWYDTATTSYKLLPAIRIFAGQGNGKFKEATGSFLDQGEYLGNSRDVILDARSVQLGDLDGDGSLDLVVSGVSYYVYGYNGAAYGYFGIVPAGTFPATRVLLNDGTGRLKDVTADWMPAPVNGDQFQCDVSRLGDLDGDGDLDLVIASYNYPDRYGVTVGHNRPLRILKCR
jgi:hypothetical protein